MLARGKSIYDHVCVLVCDVLCIIAVISLISQRTADTQLAGCVGLARSVQLGHASRRLCIHSLTLAN